MRAIRIAKTGGREVLEMVHDQAIPRPTARQVLVKNKFAGINFIDTYFREGLYSHELPMTLGKEAAGEVIEVGSQSKFAKGDRVVYSATAGAYAEYTIVDTTAIAKIPERIPYDIAAASFIQGLTAITLVEETYKVQKGDYVLVHAAAGGMGQWLTQILYTMGAVVIATASSEDKLRIAKNNGAHHVINYTTEDVVERVKAIREKGVDVVYDGVGKSTFDISLACLKRKGFFASFGNASGAVPPLSILRLAPKCITIARPQLFGYLVEDDEIEHFTSRLFSVLQAGALKVNIHQIYELEDIKEAHQALEGRQSTGKLLVRF